VEEIKVRTANSRRKDKVTVLMKSNIRGRLNNVKGLLVYLTPKKHSAAIDLLHAS